MRVHDCSAWHNRKRRVNAGAEAKGGALKFEMAQQLCSPDRRFVTEEDDAADAMVTWNHARTTHRLQQIQNEETNRGARVRPTC
jgi:hypothetical protein